MLYKKFLLFLFASALSINFYDQTFCPPCRNGENTCLFSPCHGEHVCTICGISSKETLIIENSCDQNCIGRACHNCANGKTTKTAGKKVVLTKCSNQESCRFGPRCKYVHLATQSQTSQRQQEPSTRQSYPPASAPLFYSATPQTTPQQNPPSQQREITIPAPSQQFRRAPTHSSSSTFHETTSPSEPQRPATRINACTNSATCKYSPCSHEHICAACGQLKKDCRFAVNFTEIIRRANQDRNKCRICSDCAPKFDRATLIENSVLLINNYIGRSAEEYFVICPFPECINRFCQYAHVSKSQPMATAQRQSAEEELIEIVFMNAKAKLIKLDEKNHHTKIFNDSISTLVQGLDDLLDKCIIDLNISYFQDQIDSYINYFASQMQHLIEIRRRDFKDSCFWGTAIFDQKKSQITEYDLKELCKSLIIKHILLSTHNIPEITYHLQKLLGICPKIFGKLTISPVMYDMRAGSTYSDHFSDTFKFLSPKESERFFSPIIDSNHPLRKFVNPTWVVIEFLRSIGFQVQAPINPHTMIISTNDYPGYSTLTNPDIFCVDQDDFCGHHHLNHEFIFVCAQTPGELEWKLKTLLTKRIHLLIETTIYSMIEVINNDISFFESNNINIKDFPESTQKFVDLLATAFVSQGQAGNLYPLLINIMKYHYPPEVIERILASGQLEELLNAGLSCSQHRFWSGDMGSNNVPIELNGIGFDKLLNLFHFTQEELINLTKTHFTLEGSQCCQRHAEKLLQTLHSRKLKPFGLIQIRKECQRFPNFVPCVISGCQHYRLESWGKCLLCQINPCSTVPKASGLRSGKPILTLP